MPLGILLGGRWAPAPGAEVVVASVLRCSWLCRAQRVKQRIPEDALSY